MLWGKIGSRCTAINYGGKSVAKSQRRHFSIVVNVPVSHRLRKQLPLRPLVSVAGVKGEFYYSMNSNLLGKWNIYQADPQVKPYDL